MDIAILIFDRITALDAVGPYEVLSRLPEARVTFVGLARGEVRTDNRALGLVADAALEEVTRTDLLLVPGGFGERALQQDQRLLDWLRAMDATSQWTTTVCTGSVLLAASGVLRGRRAATHWAARERLAAHGAIPIAERVVRDGKYASAAGVSAGVDLALTLALEICGPDVAEAIQLGIEYDPAPPFQSGSVEKARPEIVAAERARVRARDASVTPPAPGYR